MPNWLLPASYAGGRAFEWQGSFRDDTEQSLPGASLVMVLGCLGRVGQWPAAKLPCWCRSPLALSCARSIDTNTHNPLAGHYNAASTHAITAKTHTELRCCHVPFPSLRLLQVFS